MGFTAITSASCATTPTAYPALTCDPDAAGEMAFGYQRGGAFFPSRGTEANGTDFLFVDGACRYWAGGGSRVITGTLSGDEVTAINAELMTADWPSVDGEHVEGCCDDESIGLARDGIRASRYNHATASATLQELQRTASRWSEWLRTTGSRVAPEAPLRLEMERVRPTLEEARSHRVGN